MSEYKLDDNGYAPTVRVELPDLDEIGRAVTALLRAFQGDSVDDVYQAAHGLCGRAQDMLERADVDYEVPPDSLKTKLWGKRVRLKGTGSSHGTVTAVGKNHCVLVEWDDPLTHGLPTADWRSAAILEEVDQ